MGIDKSIEEKFINTFIVKNMRERFLFELFHLDEDKRRKALCRFADYNKYLQPNYFLLGDKKISIDEFEKEIKKLSDNVSKGYILNDSGGESMPLRKALETIWFWGGAKIIVVNEKLAILKEEQSYGPPMKYILYKSD